MKPRKKRAVQGGIVLACITGLVMLGLVLFAYSHGADLSVLNPKGPVGLEERGVIIITVVLAAIVVIPLFIMLFVFAWKYRADNPKSIALHEANWDHDNWLAEFVWWVVPAIIIIILSTIIVKTAHDLDPYKSLASSNPTMTIEVVALDWKWLFIYPAEVIATVNMVEFPENTPVRFELTADAPMNQFWIPSLGGQIMVMPGMETQLNLMANQTGTFNGLSSEISGNGFAGMDFTVKSVSQDDFTTWVQSVWEMNHPLNAQTYTELAKPSTYNPAAYYTLDDDQLYNTIIMNYMMAPTMAPQTMQMGGMTMPMSPNTPMNMEEASSTP